MAAHIYIRLNELLEAGEKLVLARIIHRSGSAPRDVGAMCIVTKDAVIGTVGGGLLEFQVTKKARQLLDTGMSYIYPFRMTSEDVAGAGMICGGDVDLYLEPVFPGNTLKTSVYKAVAGTIAAKRTATLITRIENDVSAMDQESSLFIGQDNSIVGASIIQTDNQTLDASGLVPDPNSESKLFVEKIGSQINIFLFGGGHVSQCVSKLSKMVGFQVTVIDDRAEFINEQRFPDADTLIVDEFDHVFKQLKISTTDYIVIMTRGHLYDKTILEQALLTEAAYIGMIGSIKKRNLIYQSLLDNGVLKKDLEQVYSPIGTSINAETPEEIAVSIVGELIQKRAPAKKQMLQ